MIYVIWCLYSEYFIYFYLITLPYMLQDVHKDKKQRIHGGVSITAPYNMSTEANYNGPLSNVMIQE